MNWVLLIALLLLVAKAVAQLGLGRLNRRHVLAHAGAVPEAFQATVDPETYRRSVEYTLARNRLAEWETLYDTAWTVGLLASGVLSWSYGWAVERFGGGAWALAGFLLGMGLLLTLVGWPLSWYEQFRLEERFGFNTTTTGLWWRDRAKGLLLAIALGYPVILLILKWVEWAGAAWWLWAWGCVLGVQLLMLVLAPVLILPLFNKFTPLPEGTLRERLLGLAKRTGFQAQSIQVMDGSKRSRHSNAFFTGFGRFRKIVLFDTLVQQLGGSELEAVLAHEIGHYQKRHVPKMLIWSAVSSLGGFYVISWLATQAWFYQAFGFAPGGIVPALVLFAVLGGAVSFWFSPLAHAWSRRYEYQADAYAASAMGESRSLIGALRKLNEKNLSNLMPHPFYSWFYYSHPTLLERERALTKSLRASENQAVS